MSKLDILTVSSTELVVSRAFIPLRGIIFNSNFGLGSGAYRAGEENLFLLDIIEAGGAVAHVKNVIVSHPQGDRSVSTLWQKPNRLFGMGFIARQFGLLGTLLLIRWSYRAMRHGAKFNQILELVRGFLAIRIER